MARDTSVLKAIINSVKTELIKLEWWDEVQDDVKTRLEWIINHIEHLGPLFSRSYMTLFRWEFERRKIEGDHITSPYAGFVSSLLGMRISEEAYQCGVLPTRSILDLYDYVEPNDSDVAACLFLCHKIEVLEKIGALAPDVATLKTNPSEMASVIRGNMRKKRKSRKPPPKFDNEEKITWNFDDDDENEEV